MLSLILSLITDALGAIRKDPRILYVIAVVILLAGIFRAGCSCQNTRDQEELAHLNARIYQIEHAPVKIDTVKYVTPAKAKETRELAITDKPAPDIGWKRQEDSIRTLFRDTLSYWQNLALSLSEPVDSITAPDTLKVDSLFDMPYRLRLGHVPLDHLLIGQLLPEPFDVHRELITKIQTIPPEPKRWYSYVIDAIPLLRLLIDFFE